MKQTLTQNKNRATNTITTLIADQEHLYNLEFCSPGVKRVASHFVFFSRVYKLGFRGPSYRSKHGFPWIAKQSGGWRQLEVIQPTLPM